MKQKKKKLKEDYERVHLFELDSLAFTDMSFFDKWVPEGCELTQVSFYHDPGFYDESDEALIFVHWKEKEQEN